MKKILYVVLLMFTPLIIYAQDGINEVQLVVSGDGVNKEEATAVALRSALEQAYGVFVSANTQLINDELVKDEIATVTSGNIQKFEEVSCTQLENGKTYVTLRATVSLQKLVTYAKNHGVSCEFNGTAFGANLKLLELNRKNTQIVLNNLYKELEEIANCGLFQWTLNVEDPNIYGQFKLTVNVYPTKNLEYFFNHIIKVLESISVNPEKLIAGTQTADFCICFFDRKEFYNSRKQGWDVARIFLKKHIHYFSYLKGSHYFLKDLSEVDESAESPSNIIFTILNKAINDFVISDNNDKKYNFNTFYHPYTIVPTGDPPPYPSYREIKYADSGDLDLNVRSFEGYCPNCTEFLSVYSFPYINCGNDNDFLVVSEYTLYQLPTDYLTTITGFKITPNRPYYEIQKQEPETMHSKGKIPMVTDLEYDFGVMDVNSNDKSREVFFRLGEVSDGCKYVIKKIGNAVSAKYITKEGYHDLLVRFKSLAAYSYYSSGIKDFEEKIEVLIYPPKGNMQKKEITIRGHLYNNSSTSSQYNSAVSRYNSAVSRYKYNNNGGSLPVLYR